MLKVNLETQEWGKMRKGRTSSKRKIFMWRAGTVGRGCAHISCDRAAEIVYGPWVLKADFRPHEGGSWGSRAMLYNFSVDEDE